MRNQRKIIEIEIKSRYYPNYVVKGLFVEISRCERLHNGILCGVHTKVYYNFSEASLVRVFKAMKHLSSDEYIYEWIETYDN